MTEILSIVETKKGLTKLLRNLSHAITITRHGKPVAVILPLDMYRKLVRQKTYEQILALKQQLAQSSVTAEQAYKWWKEELRRRPPAS